MRPSTSRALDRWYASTFKNHLDEARGFGEGFSYRPWHRVEEFSSEGRASRYPGWKTEKRVHHLFSDNEKRFFFLCEWSDKVLDIREQYPLLDYELGMKIARDMGIEYPRAKDGTPWIFTTDFMLTIKDGEKIKQIARTMKPEGKLSKDLVSQNFELERRYYAHFGTDWDVITEKRVPRTLAANLEWIHNDYWLEDEGDISAADLQATARMLKIRLQTKGVKINQITEQLDEELNLAGSATSLRLFRHLLARKEVQMDLLNTKVSGYLLTDKIMNITKSNT
jgi:hypothetical protein